MTLDTLVLWIVMGGIAGVLADCFDELKAHLQAWTTASHRRLLAAAPNRASFGAKRRLKGYRP